MDLLSNSGNCEEQGGNWGEQIKLFTLMSPVNSILPKQIGLPDDTVAALVSVSPANHLLTPVWTPENVLLCRKSLPPPFLSLSPPVCLRSPLKRMLTLLRASWKVISHYFLCCLSSQTYTVTCQLSAAAREYMNYACVSLSTGAVTRTYQP